jgi:beta-xylosidase
MSTSVPLGMFRNPVVAANMPDPSLLRVGDIFYLYTTQSDQANVQTATSTNLVNWKPGRDALPAVGRWATTGKTWAPEVIAVGGQYVMFYTATDSASSKQCIGRAASTSPDGPFVDLNAAALVCQDALGGSIDPNPVAQGGHLYLYWKNDGNCCGSTVHLWGQQLDSTASVLTGQPSALLSNTKPWQGNLVEAPEMIAHGGHFYIFYAANDYASTKYAEGYAVCRHPLGPCTDSSAPILTSNTAGAGPGHGFIFQLGNCSWIIYHAWSPDAIGSALPGRQLWLDPITWSPTGPAIAGPNANTQASPKIQPSEG